MGFSHAVLIAALLLLACVSPVGAISGNSCLECHQVHYVKQGTCAFCHRGNQRTSRKELAHSGLIRGRYANFTNSRSVEMLSGLQLAEKAACRRCHVLDGTGNRLATNLDNLFWTSQPEAIRSALVHPALYMPVFCFSEKDLTRLVTTVLAGGVKAGKALKEPPLVVHFSAADAAKQNIFVKNCGACHKLLSKRDGGLGSGIVGPNLSGLLSRFYPHTFENQKSWDDEGLKRWLKNPRSVRKNATMRPIPLKSEEWGELLKALAPS